MLPRSIALVVLAAWSLTAAAAEPAVGEFERFIKRARAQTEALKHLRYDEQFETWNRAAYFVRNLGYDVVKTQSLVSPLSGKVSFWLMTSYSDYPSREEALAARIEPPALSQMPSERVELAFLYRDGVWELASGRTALGASGSAWTDANVQAIAAGILNNPASSFRAFVPWMSSRAKR